MASWRMASFCSSDSRTTGSAGCGSLNVNEVVATLVALHSQLPGPPLLHLRPWRRLVIDRVHFTNSGLDAGATWSDEEERENSQHIYSHSRKDEDKKLNVLSPNMYKQDMI